MTVQGLEFSIATLEDSADHQLLECLAFGGELPTSPPYDPRPGEIRYIVRLDGRPASTACAFSYPCLVRGKEMEMAGIAGVGTAVEARRTGSARLLMTGALNDLAQRKVPLSALYAYRENYYRKLGYELCGWRWEIRCPAHRIPKTESSLPVRRVDPSDAERLLGPCYRQFIQGLSGCHLRTESGWKERMGQKPPLIYAVGDPVEGYLWGSFGGFWNEGTVGEFVWTTPESHDALLGVLAGACSSKTSVVWMEPPLSPMLYIRKDQAIDMTVHRPTMWRIVDLPSAFAALAPAESFTFSVKDEVITGNDGVWKAGPEGAAPASNPDFSLDIRALTQAFMGQPSLQELASLGRVQVHHQEGFQAACRVFSPQNVVCMEFF